MLSLYFVVQTVATVGYGDVNPTNSEERIFVIFLMLSGVVAFSFVSGSISSLMLSIDDMASSESSKLARLRHLKQNFNFHEDLFLSLIKNIGQEKNLPDTSWLFEEID
jgi:Ion channel